MGPDEDEAALSNPVASYLAAEHSFYVGVKMVQSSVKTAVDSIWTRLLLIHESGGGPDSQLASITLTDDGVGGDILPSDDIYAQQFPSPLPLGAGGVVWFEINARLGEEVLTAADTVQLTRHRPEILSVSASNTIEVKNDPVVDILQVKASDPDGLDDLKSVTFQIVKPDGTLGASDGKTVFYLLDDGVHDGILWFDQDPGDGVYSGGITFSPQNPKGTYTLRFVARDLAGALSDTANHVVEIQ